MKATMEADTLQVIRSIEDAQYARAPKETPKAQKAETPSPEALLDSLEQKRKLVSLLDGYVKGPDIEAMKIKLNEAIGDLEKIIGKPGASDVVDGKDQVIS